ncbi:MAG: hypothetical protein HGA22_14980, partial [Clostridiales bacterium]|nr:hypothetical protein [Clostridiales bacterium]
YYLGIPGKLKTIINRTYAESAIGRKIKNAVLLTAACKKELEITELVVDYYKKLCTYLGWNNLGLISALWVNAALDWNCSSAGFATYGGR